MKKKMHLRDRRLWINAGMHFPACFANQTPLDTDKSRLWTTPIREDVTCKNCLKKRD